MSNGERAEALQGVGGNGAAFFDVDETLINIKSMQSFLDYYFRNEVTGHCETPWNRFHESVAGLSREEGNRAYYRLWAGQRLEDLERGGVAWFSEVQHREDFFIRPALEELRLHQLAGRLIFFVSGSFRPCLSGLAKSLGVTRVYCTELAEQDAVLTGEVSQSCIGEGKRRAVQQAIASYGLAHQLTWAYGDHVSDLPMLKSVAHASVVSPSPSLRSLAELNSWSVLSPAITKHERKA